uniref:(northern house mosquito) hypothetical protein n=1 Tax=Culex pipiens TaxID=7175 RepID=A0A8D8FEU8_CULPI
MLRDGRCVQERWTCPGHGTDLVYRLRVRPLSAHTAELCQKGAQRSTEQRPSAGFCGNCWSLLRTRSTKVPAMGQTHEDGRQHLHLRDPTRLLLHLLCLHQFEL